MDNSTTLHEPRERLQERTLELHRAVVSLMEELEAIDWYGQRRDATRDEALRAVLEHNRKEEMEHAAMTLEWIRRNEPVFDEILREHLFAEGDIVAGHRENGAGDGGARPADLGLGIASLRHEGPAVAAAEESA
jgi:ferritin-like protein